MKKITAILLAICMLIMTGQRAARSHDGNRRGAQRGSFKKWANLRGVEIVSFGVNSVKASEKDEAMIKELQRNAVFLNTNMAAAHLVGAQAMQDAAKNAGGAITGFMGMNMAQGGGMNAAQLFQMGAQQPQQSAQPSVEGWKCSCGATVTGKFCPECGSKKPEPCSDDAVQHGSGVFIFDLICNVQMHGNVV